MWRTGDPRRGARGGSALGAWGVLLALAALVTPAEAGSRTACTLRLALADSVAVETLAFDMTYRSTKFDFSAVASTCRAAAPALAVDVSDTRLSAQHRQLSVSLLALGGTLGPVDLLVCDVGIGGALPVEGDDYSILVVSAADTESMELDPLPMVVVSQVQCSVTTTTSTTTTLVPSSSTTTLPPERCTFDIVLDEDVELARLELAIDYASAGGVPAEDPVCSGFPPPAVAYVVDDVEQRLTLAAVAAAGFDGPRTLARCGFVPRRFKPVPTDFVVEVTEAYDKAGTALAMLPVVELLPLSCPSDPTTTTTTTSTTTTTTTSTTTSTTSTSTTTTSTTTTSTSTSTTTLPESACGDANGDGSVSATDALLVLRASIDLETCARGRCDADGNGTISATDALVVLNFAVGREVTLNCSG